MDDSATKLKRGAEGPVSARDVGALVQPGRQLGRRRRMAQIATALVLLAVVITSVSVVTLKRSSATSLRTVGNNQSQPGLPLGTQVIRGRQPLQIRQVLSTNYGRCSRAALSLVPAPEKPIKLLSPNGASPGPCEALGPSLLTISSVQRIDEGLSDGGAVLVAITMNRSDAGRLQQAIGQHREYSLFALVLLGQTLSTPDFNEMRQPSVVDGTLQIAGGMSQNDLRPSEIAAALGSPIFPTATIATVPIGGMSLLSPGVGWAVNGLGLYLTDDSGKTWRNVSPPNTEDPIARITDLKFTDQSHAWAAVTRNDLPLTIFRSADGGATWTPGELPNCQPPDSGCGGAYLSFANTQQGWALSYQGRALYSTNDGAKTWTLRGHAPFYGPIDFLNSGDGYGVSEPQITARVCFNSSCRGGTAHGGGALFRTTDGGISWQKMSLAPPARYRSFQVKYGLPRFFGASGVVPAKLTSKNSSSTRVVIFTTSNGGRSWDARLAPNDPNAALQTGKVPLFPFSAADSRHWALYIGPKLYTSANSGHSWTPISPSPNSTGVLAVTFVSAANGWALLTTDTCAASDTSTVNCIYPALWSTSDGGWTWRSLSPG